MFKSIYLSGAISGRNYDDISNWREKVTKLWPGKCYNPLRRGYNGVPGAVSAIVELDKIDIQRSDVLLVYFDRPSVGTAMEMLYAWDHGKLVVLVKKDHDIELSPWAIYHCHKIADSIEDALQWIREIA